MRIRLLFFFVLIPVVAFSQVKGTQSPRSAEFQLQLSLIANCISKKVCSSTNDSGVDAQMELLTTGKKEVLKTCISQVNKGWAETESVGLAIKGTLRNYGTLVYTVTLLRSKLPSHSVEAHLNCGNKGFLNEVACDVRKAASELIGSSTGESFFDLIRPIEQSTFIAYDLNTQLTCHESGPGQAPDPWADLLDQWRNGELLDPSSSRKTMDLVPQKHGVGFSKSGKECQRICEPGEYLSVDPIKDANYWKSFWESPLRDWEDPPLLVKSECLSCPANSVTRPEVNGCFKSKDHKCTIFEDYVEYENTVLFDADDLPKGSVKVSFKECRPKCPDGIERNPSNNYLCAYSFGDMTKLVDEKIKALKNWKPDQLFQGARFGKCDSSDLIQVARKFKSSQLEYLESFKGNYFEGAHPPSTQSFGEFFQDAAPNKCRRNYHNEKTDKFVIRVIDSMDASEVVWEQFSGPYEDDTPKK